MLSQHRFTLSWILHSALFHKPACIVFLCVCLLFPCMCPLKASGRQQPVSETVASNRVAFEYYYYAAVTAINNEEYDRALLLLQFCVALQPENAAANAMLALLYDAMGLDDAMEYYDQAISSDPDNWVYRRHYVEALSRKNRFQKAIALVKDELHAHPDNEDALDVLAVMYKADEQYKAAIATLDRMEKQVGVSEYISMEKYQLYMAMDKPAKGIAEIDKLIAEFPNDDRYQVFRGNIYMQQNQPDQAYAIYRKVLAENPENPFVYLALSEYYQQQNQPDQALNAIMTALENKQLDLETKLGILVQYVDKLIDSEEHTAEIDTLLHTMVELYPLEEQVYSFYAMYLERKGRESEAEDALRTMLDINPKNKDTWQRLVVNAFARSDYREVADILKDALAECPDSPQWYLMRSVVCYEIGEADEALQMCLTGLEYLPEESADRADFYVQLGDLYYKKKQKKEAFEYYEKAMEIAPGNLLLLNNYAYYLAVENQDLKRAERMSAKTVEAEPQNPVYLDTYAWIFYRQGDYSLAKFYIERAVDNLKQEEEKNDPEIWEHYGFILLATGDEQKGREALQKALELGSENEVVRQKLQETE